MQQTLPLTNNPNQSFTATLEVDGSPLTLGFDINYNEIAGYWVMAISDQSGNLLVEGIPFITGDDPACNILGQFAYLKIGSAFVLNVNGLPGEDFPSNVDLGTGFILVWGDTPVGQPNPNVVPPVQTAVVITPFFIPSNSLPWNPSDPGQPYYYTSGGINGPQIPCAPGQQVIFTYVNGTIAAGGPSVTGAGSGAGTTGGVHPWPSDRLPGGFITGSGGECLAAFIDSTGLVLGLIRVDLSVTTPPAPIGTTKIQIGVNLVGGGWGVSTGGWNYTYQYV